MKLRRILIPVLIFLSSTLSLYGQVNRTYIQAARQWVTASKLVNDPSVLGIQQYANGGVATVVDQVGSFAQTWGFTISGTAPATTTITVNGCMAVGNCTSSNLASSTSTSSFILSTGTLFNFYTISVTWTGGNNTTVVVLNTILGAGITSPMPGFPNVGYVSGNSTISTNPDLCGAIKALTGVVTGGIVNVSNYTGTQVCGGSNVQNMINSSFAGTIQLGCPLIMYVPLQSSGAANPGGNGDPLQGTIIIPPRVTLVGCSDAGASGTVNVTTIKACPAASGPAACYSGLNTGYVPATHEFPVSAVTLTTAAGNRTYMTATIAGGDIQGAEPLRFQNYQNTTNNSFPVRVCQQIQGNGSNNASKSRVDGACPISVPTATSVAFPVNSGVWSVASITGTNTGYAGAITWNTGATGGCLYPASGIATQSAGSVNAVQIQNRGRGCTSQPTATPFGATGGSNALLTFNIATVCASNCGIIHASIPLIETGPFPTNNAFHQQVLHLTIDCTLLPDCVNFRTLTMNEGSKVNDVLATNTVERCYDAHTFTVQNSDSWDGDQCTAGASPANDPGTTAIYVGEYGPHGIKDFTGNFSNSANSPLACLVLDSDVSFSYLFGGHCENTLYNILAGADGPTRGFTVDHWSGAPQGVSFCASGCTNGAVGPFQNEAQSVIKIRSEYFTNVAPVTTVISGDYAASAISRNSASGTAGTISDDNPVNGGQGYWIADLFTMMYSVDQTSNGSESVLTGAQQGSFLGTANANAIGNGGNFWNNWVGGGTNVTFTQNAATVWKVILPNLLPAATHIMYAVTTADNTANLYDIGLYGPNCVQNTRCPLAFDMGAVAGTSFAPATGVKGQAVAMVQAPATLLPGSYLLAMTTNCAAACATLSGTAVLAQISGNTSLVTAGGALTTGGVTVPANAPNTNAMPVFVIF